MEAAIGHEVVHVALPAGHLHPFALLPGRPQQQQSIGEGPEEVGDGSVHDPLIPIHWQLLLGCANRGQAPDAANPSIERPQGSGHWRPRCKGW
jgi:hypothetical protein